jgi:site-specific DNA recombinase
MQGVFAEYERALIHERTRRGQLFAARQGRVNWGNPPYGYTYIHKTTDVAILFRTHGDQELTQQTRCVR